MRLNIIIIFLLLGKFVIGQTTKCTFVNDTIFIPKENKVYSGEYLEATFKNKTIVRVYKTNNGKYYLKFIIQENLYFDKVDVLEIKSGSKSFYAKDTKQIQLDKHTGCYVVEIFKNYIFTLKEDGITGITFNKAETNYTKQDCSQAKQIAKCLYDVVNAKK